MSVIDFPTSPAPPTAAAPHNRDAEQAILGAILYDNAAYERVPDGFRAAQFFEPFHGRMYTAMEEAIRKGQLAEPIMIGERFKADPAFADLGAMRFLAKLIDDAPPPAVVPAMALVVRDLSDRRELLRISSEIAEDAKADKESTAAEITERAEQALYALAETGAQSSGVSTFATALSGALEAIGAAFSSDGGVSGVSTGLVDLDKKLGGLHPSDLSILAGRPSMGKTALATNVAFNVARAYAYEQQPDGTRKTTAGGQVLFFSLEMSEEQLAMRILAEASGVSGDRMRKGEITPAEYARIRDASIEISQAPLFIDDTGGLSMAKLAARARRQKRLTGLDLIVVDYLQLVTTTRKNGDNRVQEVSEVTQGLKALAKDLDVPVLALSQLSRQVENREDKRPQLSDLRESGSIEQDADVVMFVYREAYYKSRAEPKENTPEHLVWQEEMDVLRGVADVIIGKQRHGPIGTVKLSFNEDLTKFGNLARDNRWDLR